MSERPDAFCDALVCHRAGRYREAETLQAESLARQPHQSDTWNLMGATLAGLRRYPEAENAYRQALALQPNHLGALNNLAVLLRQTGRAEEARQTYLETLRQEPRHVDAWNNLAALHAGLPVLTCAGRSFAARGAGSLLQSVGMSALVTGNLSEYATTALELATHPERLASLRRALAARLQAGPLFDAERFRRHLEAACRAMWARRQAGEAPADIVVPAAGRHPAA